MSVPFSLRDHWTNILRMCFFLFYTHVLESIDWNASDKTGTDRHFIKDTIFIAQWICRLNALRKIAVRLDYNARLCVCVHHICNRHYWQKWTFQNRNTLLLTTSVFIWILFAFYVNQTAALITFPICQRLRIRYFFFLPFSYAMSFNSNIYIDKVSTVSCHAVQ